MTDITSDQWQWDDQPAEDGGKVAELQAELQNLRTRARRDRDKSYDAGRYDTLEALLPVLDSIHGAKAHGDVTEENPLTPVVASLANILERVGLYAIGEEGDAFNPDLHEAVKVEVDPDAEKTLVTEVLQRGYGTPDRLLRAAKVAVVKP